MTARFDHIVVAASTLAAGAAWVAGRLGVACRPGGRHPQMATHNRLLALGGSRYLEVIAIDPAAPAPAHRRWFGLDAPAMQARLAASPGLVAWVARVATIERVAARSPLPLGAIETMCRDRLTWRLTVPADGSLPEGGALPLLIEWPADTSHPAVTLPDDGCRLLRFRIGHPEPTRLSAALATIGFADDPGLLVIERRDKPLLAIEVATPRGVRCLGG